MEDFLHEDALCSYVELEEAQLYFCQGSLLFLSHYEYTFEWLEDSLVLVFSVPRKILTGLVSPHGMKLLLGTVSVKINYVIIDSKLL